ncbi:conjugal transfer protein TraW [Paraburkholderia sp. LEh10]|uniref:conjugal transfer protein TraW n=1 Tax=Paraburkholderia sp. LEh10 TaxID=2821353 RepID=UPI001AE26344|nr:conjugal transfer protein TraW [Paraburkholderia sp. LEh10]MBP0588714.1 conjugal transfer protein TraW [Paraburkholderia sp. LEh10]
MKLRKTVLCAALAGSTLLSTSSAYAVCDGCVVSAVEQASMTLNSLIQALGTSFTTLFNEIDTDIASVGTKVSNAVTQASDSQREMALEVQRQQEMDQVARETELPIDPCATSSSNYAVQAVSGAASTSSSLRPGGAHVSYPPLEKALNSPAPSVEASRRTSAAIHADNYCTPLELQLGYPGCKSSQLPDGDADVDSIFIGAGLPGKSVDLTFTQQQQDAARAYARMSIDPQPPESINKAEAGTEAGKLYIAMQKGYQANMSSAIKPMNDLIGSRQPFNGSTQLIQELKQSDAAAQYFNATASSVAKSTGTMSLAELEDFEAGRRWKNPYWHIEFGAVADPTKLLRELLFATAFQVYQTHEHVEAQRQTNLLLGQLLAANERGTDRTAIETQLQRVRATNAR